MNPEAMSDADLERKLRQVQAEITGLAKAEVLRKAEVSRGMSPVEGKPPQVDAGPSEEAVWIAVGLVAAAASFLCLWLTLPTAK